MGDHGIGEIVGPVKVWDGGAKDDSQGREVFGGTYHVGERIIMLVLVGIDLDVDGYVAFGGWERLAVVADLLRKELAASCQVA
jgi:hypothetical protein